MSKGAPEVLLGSCVREATADGDTALDSAKREAMLAAARDMAGAALRVLAVAEKPGGTREDAEEGLTFLGLVGMIDPPRPEAKAAIQTCKQAGIKAVMITGDHPLTAQAIAASWASCKRAAWSTGPELEALSEPEFARGVEEIEVYARVSPAHKMRVVTALQERGHVVAMTGDGVNDAPALKKADIGVAMGIAGTEVSREAAAMTLTDDNFASIVAAVEEGRGIFGNIKKYLMYLLSSNIGRDWPDGRGVAGGPAAAAERRADPVCKPGHRRPAGPGVSGRSTGSRPDAPPAARPAPGVFTRPVVILMLVGGLWSAVVNLLLFTGALWYGCERDEAMTLTFVSLVLIQFFKAYNFRSDRQSVLHRPFANRWLNLAVLWELGCWLPSCMCPCCTCRLGPSACPGWSGPLF